MESKEYPHGDCLMPPKARQALDTYLTWAGSKWPWHFSRPVKVGLGALLGAVAVLGLLYGCKDRL